MHQRPAGLSVVYLVFVRVMSQGLLRGALLRTPLHLVPLDQKLRRVRPAEREAVAIKGAELLELHRLRPGHFDLPVDLVAFHLFDRQIILTADMW